MHVSGLFRYPVKSLRGHSLDEAVVERCGIAHDRRWMVIDARDRFVTRREVPAMALVDVAVTDGGLLLGHPHLGSCAAIVPDDDAPVVEALVWRDSLPVRLGNLAADAFLSEALGLPVRLACQHDAALRPVHSSHASDGDHVSLADGFPLLVTTEASLAALNERLPSPVTMTRFRPNLVIAGAEPWAESRWRRIRIGETVLRLAKPCSRCVIVTQDPDTGERRDGNEPLATLRAMGRVDGGKILFGENAIPERLGTMRTGDIVEMMEDG
jgi:uncharacterized protein YcbX